VTGNWNHDKPMVPAEPALKWADTLYLDVIHSTTDKLLIPEKRRTDENGLDVTADDDGYRQDNGINNNGGNEYDLSENTFFTSYELNDKSPSHIGKDVFITPYG
jgi:hypothetical protein